MSHYRGVIVLQVPQQIFMNSATRLHKQIMKRVVLNWHLGTIGRVVVLEVALEVVRV